MSIEEIRQMLCEMYKRALNKDPPEHVVLQTQESHDKEVKELDSIINQTYALVVKLKDKLKEREELINKNGQPNVEVAICSQEIRNMFTALEETMKDLEIIKNDYQQNGDKEQQEKIEKHYAQMQITYQNLKEWQLHRDNDQKKQYNPLLKLSEQNRKAFGQNKNEALTSKPIMTSDELDLLIPKFENVEEAMETLKQLDDKLEQKAGQLLQKAKLMHAQANQHSATLKEQDELIHQIHTKILDNKDDIKGLNKTSEEIQKKVFRGSKCMVISIVILVILVSIWWIYKIAS